jgi:DNA-binding transcriptional ArsR family regulator
MKLTELKAIQLAELFSALSDASRLRIISLLNEGEMNVGALAEGLTMTVCRVPSTAWIAANAPGSCEKIGPAGILLA